ncbi:MAG: hypothetical protein IPL79_16695 [Myxococcales bacterium]|nr:hypothetical protein [Myxococcales bacterium]
MAASAEATYHSIVQAVLAASLDATQAAHVALLLAYHPARESAEVFTTLNNSLAQAVANVRTPRSALGAFHVVNFDAWVLAHVGDDELVANLASFDERLLALLQDRSIAADCGLRRGVAGAALYALERWHRGDHLLAATMFEAIVTRLRGMARYDEHGCFWTTGYDAASDTLDPVLSTGYQNLGLLHGIPGVISVLGSIAETGTVPCADLVRDGARWVLSQFVDDDAYPSRLPSVVGDPELARRVVSAWCRGAVGALAGLWNGLRRAGLSETQLEPQIQYVLGRERAPSRVVDAGICHGAAGMSQIFYRFYYATGRSEFLNAAQARLAQAQACHVPTLDFGGYGAWNNRPRGSVASWKDDCTLLDGAVGVALAMQATWLGEEPAWDRILAINIPKLNPGLGDV